MKKILLAITIIIFAGGLVYKNTFIRLYQGLDNFLHSKEKANYYLIKGDGPQIRDITQKLISDKSAPAELKQDLISGERRIIIFKYPSGTQYVAGYYSYITKGAHPVMIFLRGGNGFFGIMRPNNRFSFLTGYNVIGTLYRGNIYGGIDEFGGNDLQDIESLLKFFPELESFTHVDMPCPYSMLGVSRGAMEMFLSLNNSNFVKSKVNRAISVSGNIDLNVSIKNRPEMDYLFKSKFKESEYQSYDAWIRARNPVDNINRLSPSLKILLVYGLSDNRVYLEEQDNFKKLLDKKGIITKLITVPGANHGFDGQYKELEEIITNFQ